MSSITDQWLRKHSRPFHGATMHPFLLAIRDGSVDLSCYKCWLGQDYIFVKGFVRFLASVLLRFPKNQSDPDLMILLNGISALADEIKWFQAEASKWQIHLSDLTLHHATQSYLRLLEDLCEPSVDYTVSISTLWIIETIYYESFSMCLKPGASPPAELLEACNRWGNSEFGEYCAALKVLADKALEVAKSPVLQEAEQVFMQIIEHEACFWNMSTDAIVTNPLAQDTL